MDKTRNEMYEIYGSISTLYKPEQSDFKIRIIAAIKTRSDEL